jgi:MFS family permease
MGFMVGPAVGAAVGAISGSKRTAFFSPVVIASVCLCVALFKIKETRPGGGVFGPRHPMADEIFDAGKKAFQAHMRNVKKLARQQRSVSTDSVATTSSAGSNGTEITVVDVEGGPAPKLPTVVFACAAAVVLAAMSFTAMTSMCGLVWLNLFNYGPTELGLFLTGFGSVSIVMNVCGVKAAIRNFGAYRAVMAACVLQAIGITGFTFIDIFPLHILYFVAFIGIGWSMTLPTMLFIAGEFTPPQLRGAATGIIAGSMSLGFAISPLMSGPIFQSNVLKLAHQHGSFSHLFFIIAGVGFGIIELIVICKYIGPMAKTLNPANKEKQSKSKSEKPRKEMAGHEDIVVTPVVEIEIQTQSEVD